MCGCRFCFLNRTKQACLFVWRKRADKCCGCTSQGLCQTFTKSSIIKNRCCDKLPNLPYKHQQWFICNYSSSHLGCFPASGSSFGLAYALNQALSLPIISVAVAVLTFWRSSSAFVLGQRRERSTTDKKECIARDTAKMSRRCSEKWRIQRHKIFWNYIPIWALQPMRD